MHENELRRQIAELVADHAELAASPPVAVIRRRGRRRRARQASGAVLLMVAVAAGLVAPVVTQPSRPASSFADDVQAYLDATFVDMTVVVLDRGTASGYSWQLAAVRGTIRHTHVSKVCLVRRLDVPGRSYGISCLGENSQRDLASLTFGGGLKKMPLWGLAPQGTARVRLLGPKGTTPIEVPAKDIGPGFDRSYYLAPWTPKIQTVLAFDGQGDQIARYPPRF